ncbi:hypothetical protein ACLOJK_029352, partial [Asimina triloba]
AVSRWQTSEAVMGRWTRATAGAGVDVVAGGDGSGFRLISSVRCVWSRQFRDWLDIVDMMDGVDLLMESSPVKT